MKSTADWLLLLVVLMNLSILGTGRLSGAIRILAWQGIVLSLMPIFLPGHEAGPRLWLLAAITLVVKGLVIPKLLDRTLRASEIRSETDPLLGFGTSTAMGVALLAAGFWLAERLPVPPDTIPTRLVLPVGLATLFTGLLLIVCRRQALLQVIGYVVLEDGIYILGVALAHEEPLLIELGVLLDVFVGVFVMGIAVFHISRTFDHIDVQQLSELKG
jgi:hydrogenase-4 component E